MKVYRLLIDSAKRRPDGHEFDFEWDISGLITARDLKGHTWMAAVECMVGPHPVLRSVPDLQQGLRPPLRIIPYLTDAFPIYSWESWSGAPSSIICFLPGYTGFGYYGYIVDTPYVRKKAMSCLIQGDRLNQSGSLEFRVMRDGDSSDLGVRPCLSVGGGAYGRDFSFSLAFWQVSGLSPEKPLAPTYIFL